MHLSLKVMWRKGVGITALYLSHTVMKWNFSDMMTSPVTLFPKHQATQKMLSLSQSAMSASGSIDARREQTVADSDDYLVSRPTEKPYV